jgi:peptidyl-prolyl cis-trans isomerase B (cyclophilin B)
LSDATRDEPPGEEPKTADEPSGEEPESEEDDSVPTRKQRRAAAKRKLQRQLERRAQQARRRRILTIAGLASAVVVVVALVAWLVFFDKGSSSSTASSTTTPPPTQNTAAGQLPPFIPPADLGSNCQYPKSAEQPAKNVNPPRTGKVPTTPPNISVAMLTDQGPISLQLDNAKSPCTVNSFASLANQQYFEGTKCHRLTTYPDLSVLQCGDPKGDGTGSPGYQFADEYPTNQYPDGSPELKKPIIYPRGTVAMANSGPGTNGSQFFLVYKDSKLPPNFTVFGTIQPDGLATLDKIAAAGTADGKVEGQPKVPVNIKYIRLD